MNDQTSQPPGGGPAPALPPIQSTAQVMPPRYPLRLALGENADEREPISGVAASVECILRQPRRVMYQLRQPGSGRLIAAMLFVSVLCSVIYGVIAGSFSGQEQWWAAPVKIAGGLMIATLICLPSLYIFGCLSGSQARLVEIVGMISGMLMLMTVLLIGFAPVAWLFSQSTESIGWMGFLHLLFWAVATIFGLRFLWSAFAHSNARSQAGLNTWIVIFMLVALQMTTALRPILGRSDTFFPTEKKFFVTHWMDCVETSQSRQSRSSVD